MHSSQVNANNKQCKKKPYSPRCLCQRRHKKRGINKICTVTKGAANTHVIQQEQQRQNLPSLLARSLQSPLCHFLHKCAFPCGLDIGMLCGQSDYPNPSLGSHGVSGIQTFFQLVGRFYQNTQPSVRVRRRMIPAPFTLDRIK